MTDEQLILDALRAMISAGARMRAEMAPSVPLPRPRRFYIAEGIVWPSSGEDGEVDWNSIHIPEDGRWQIRLPGSSADQVIKRCRRQPRLILRALRRIQAATAWCEARLEGRMRAAAEVKRQQQRAVEALEAEKALAALRDNGF